MTLWYSRARVIVMLLVEQHSNSAMREGATATDLVLTVTQILRQTGGPDVGGVREPLLDLQEGDREIAAECVAMINAVKAKL